MPAVKLTWQPREGLKKLAQRLDNRGPLVRKCQNIMLAMVNTIHQRAGIPSWKISQRAKREGGRTGYMTGRMQRGWRPVPGRLRIENSVAYAPKFYYGQPAHTENVPAHYRRVRRGGRTAGMTMVRAHTKRAPAQVARPINWTPRYIGYVEEAILKHVIK